LIYLSQYNSLLFSPTLYCRDALQVCALNGYGCVDTEYAWYQQQQQQQLMSPYTSLLMAGGCDHVPEDANRTVMSTVYPADYCPSCIALYAAEADAAAAATAVADATATSR